MCQKFRMFVTAYGEGKIYSINENGDVIWTLDVDGPLGIAVDPFRFGDANYNHSVVYSMYFSNSTLNPIYRRDINGDKLQHVYDLGGKIFKVFKNTNPFIDWSTIWYDSFRKPSGTVTAFIKGNWIQLIVVLGWQHLWLPVCNPTNQLPS